MREILFRGKRVDGKGWVEGSYVNRHGRHSIVNQKPSYMDYDVQVIPESVGQSLDFNDHHGDRIFEGDIVECYDYSSDDPNWGLDKKHSGVVTYIGNSFILKIQDCYLDNWVNAERINIIGNIHDK